MENLKFNAKSEHVQEMPQSHTADQPMAPWGRDTENLQKHDIKETKWSNQLSFTQGGDWKTRKNTKYCIRKQGPKSQPPPPKQWSNNKQWINNNRKTRKPVLTSLSCISSSSLFLVSAYILSSPALDCTYVCLSTSISFFVSWNIHETQLLYY